MKILTSLTYYNPYISGLTKYAYNLARGLMERGHEVRVLTMRYAKELKAEEKMDGVTVIRVNPVIKISKSFLSLDWIWKAMLEVHKAEVVIIHLPQPEAMWTALWAALEKKELLLFIIAIS